MSPAPAPDTVGAGRSQPAPVDAGGAAREQHRNMLLSRVKQITSPGWRLETSAWCTGKTQRDRVEMEVGGGIGMGNTCKSMADSFQCMTKPTTIL